MTMHKIYKNFIKYSCLAILCSCLLACGGGGSSGSSSDTSTSSSSSSSATTSSITSISVSPATATIADGLTEQFTATVTYADGSTTVLTSSSLSSKKLLAKDSDDSSDSATGSDGVTWTSTNKSEATINANGLATVDATSGTDYITATYDGVTSSPAVLTATAAALESVSITPTTATIADGKTEQYAASANYSDGSSSPLTSNVEWASTDPSVASIDSSSGLATVKATTGTTKITATYDGLMSATPAVLTATAAQLDSISISPLTATIADGLTEQYTATGTYSDGSTSTLNSDVTWASTNPTVASIDSTGLATVNATSGTADISATYAGVTSTTSAVLTATAAQLESISVSPLSATIAKGLTEQYTATGTYSDGSTSTLTSGVTWKSNHPKIASINSSSGLATVKSAKGTADITATYDGLTNTTAAVLTATAAQLESVSVTPLSATIAKGLTEQYTATGTYSDGTSSTLTSDVTWTSATPTVASIDDTGLATVKAASGSTKISATYDNVSSSSDAVLTATAASLQSISVSPVTATIAKGLTEQYTATGNYSDGTTSPLTSEVDWTSSTPKVASIDDNGLATVNAASGTTNISASYNGVTSTTNAVLTATSATLESISVSPATATVAKGSTEQYTATGTYSDGSTSTLNSDVTWASGDTSVATIDDTGLATVKAASGTSDITATYSDVTSGNAVLTATSAALESVSVSPLTATVGKGLTKQYKATVNYSDGTSSTVTSGVTWNSSDTDVASINSSGLATANADSGTSNITATYDDMTSATAGVFTATTAELESIAVTPTSVTVPHGETEQYTAIGTYSDGSTLDLSSLVTWASSDTDVATISTSGLATSDADSSSSKITATYDGIKSNKAVFTAEDAVLKSIKLTPTYVSLTGGTGSTEQMEATGHYSDSSTMNLTYNVSWSTDDSSVATVDEDGVLTCEMGSGFIVGRTSVDATADGIKAEAEVTCGG